MQTHSIGYIRKLLDRKEHFPWSGHFELTYRCNLNCIHCYCKGSEDKSRELDTKEIKNIIDIIYKEGCLFLTFSGGEPLVREDFLEIYSYAKEKGFITTIFTNAALFTKKIIDYLKKSPPHRIEITLNGITKETYESITQVRGSFFKVTENIKALAKGKLPLKIKSNSLKQNKGEIFKIKKWTEDLLGRPSDNKYFFQYDTMIYPRLNGDKTPLDYRLSFEEMQESKIQDSDMWKEYQKGLHIDMPKLTRDKKFLYHCNSWFTNFFINPYGRLKFCEFSEKFSVDLKTTSFREGFYKIFPNILNERFKTDSMCINCGLRPVCCQCPAKAALETANEEHPVKYYCGMAEAFAKRLKRGGIR